MSNLRLMPSNLSDGARSSSSCIVGIALFRTHNPLVKGANPGVSTKIIEGRVSDAS
jgi:hypothetical protein